MFLLCSEIGPDESKTIERDVHQGWICFHAPITPQASLYFLSHFPQLFKKILDSDLFTKLTTHVIDFHEQRLQKSNAFLMRIAL